MRISDWSSDVCSSDLLIGRFADRGKVCAIETHQRLLLDDGRHGAGDIGEFRRRGLMQNAELEDDAAFLHALVVAYARFQQIAVGKDQLLTAEAADARRSEEHTSELQSLMRISYAVFCVT